MLELKVISPSESPYLSLVVLVKKKDGKTRFCVDYRGLKKVTIKDRYPLPDIQDALDVIKGASVFSLIDMNSGYWQMEIAENDRPKRPLLPPTTYISST